jgi:hypothetical protein
VDRSASRHIPAHCTQLPPLHRAPADRHPDENCEPARWSLGTQFQFRTVGFESLAVVGVTMPPWPGDGEAIPVEGVWTPTIGARDEDALS